MDRPNDIDEWGMTNNPLYLELATKYYQAMIADGWIEEKHQFDSMEPEHHLTKEGFITFIYLRDHTKDEYWNGEKYEISIDMWGPDKLLIKPPDEYDFNAMKQMLRHCNVCDADDVDVQRYSFAGRCCSKCIEEARKKTEYPGWDR